MIVSDADTIYIYCLSVSLFNLLPLETTYSRTKRRNQWSRCRSVVEWVEGVLGHPHSRPDDALCNTFCRSWHCSRWTLFHTPHTLTPFLLASCRNDHRTLSRSRRTLSRTSHNMQHSCFFPNYQCAMEFHNWSSVALSIFNLCQVITKQSSTPGYGCQWERFIWPENRKRSTYRLGNLANGFIHGYYH